MLTSEKYANLLNSGLLLDHYFVLLSIHNKNELPNLDKIEGFKNFLQKKGYLTEKNDLTAIAVELIQDAVLCVPQVQEIPKSITDFKTWVSELHVKCQNRLLEHTGKKQKVDKIGNKGYSFLPNLQDFTKNLHTIIVSYKLKDFQLIEKCILRYIDKCNKAGNWFPTLYYYIYKNKKSDLVSDLESFEEEETIDNSNLNGEIVI